MLLDGPNWQLVFFGSERFASWRSYVPNYAEPCPRALMEFDGEGRQARTRALKLATGAATLRLLRPGYRQPPMTDETTRRRFGHPV